MCDLLCVVSCVLCVMCEVDLQRLDLLKTVLKKNYADLEMIM